MHSHGTCALCSQDEDDALEKNEVIEMKDPTHYSKLDPKSLKVCEQYFLSLVFKMQCVPTSN